MKHRNQHEWGFMGNDTKGRGDLVFCPLCDRWAWNGDYKLFKMSAEKYQEMIDTGEITGI